MKTNTIVLLAVLLFLSSCRKEIISYHPSSIKEEQVKLICEDKKELSNPSSAMISENVELEMTSEDRKLKTLEKKETVRKQQAKPLILKELKKEIKKREKKEMNPRLSRALWLTIPGGLAVTLGILLYGVAPTGLFIFAFSIVFLIGLISLISYWINPKPKM